MNAYQTDSQHSRQPLVSVNIKYSMIHMQYEIQFAEAWNLFGNTSQRAMNGFNVWQGTVLCRCVKACSDIVQFSQLPKIHVFMSNVVCEPKTEHKYYGNMYTINVTLVASCILKIWAGNIICVRFSWQLRKRQGGPYPNLSNYKNGWMSDFFPRRLNTPRRTRFFP